MSRKFDIKIMKKERIFRNIILTPDQDKWLKEHKEKTVLSMAAIIRKLIDEAIKNEQQSQLHERSSSA